jgi:ribonuclease HI
MRQDIVCARTLKLMDELEIYIDGASKGNPGHAGAGVIIYKDGKVLKEISQYIGQTTNNVAEYTAFIYALQECLLQKAENISVKTDSQLLYCQISKVYRVKHPNIVNLYAQAVALISGFKKFTIQHIPREKNTQADKLANLAVKNHQPVSV